MIAFEFEQVAIIARPETARHGQQVNGFEKVAFALAVVAADEIGGCGKFQIQAVVVAKVSQAELAQDHLLFLATDWHG